MGKYKKIILALISLIILGTGTVSLAAKDKVKPVISKIVVKPTVVKTNQDLEVSFSLSEKAKVTLNVYKGTKLIKTGLNKSLKNKGVVKWVWKEIKAEGTYTIKITAVDLAGNISKLQTINFKVVKPQPPKTPIKQPSNDDLNTQGTYQRNFTLTEAGATYGPARGTTTVAGNVILKSNNITLRNLKIIGTLTIDPGADGDALIDNITASKIEILSGAPHSIKIVRVIAEVLLVRYDNDVRIVTSGGTIINETKVESGASLVTNDNSTFGDVAINAVDQTVNLDGTFSEVSIFGAGSTVLAAAGSNISEVLVRTSVELVGDFSETNVSVVANNVNLTIADNTEVKELAIDAMANLTVDSTAKVEQVNVKADVKIDGTISGILTISVNNITCTINDGAVVNTIQQAEGVTNSIVINNNQPEITETPVTTEPPVTSEQPDTTTPTTPPIDETPVLSGANEILATSIGTLTGGNITAVPTGTTVSILKAGLTISEGATVEILNGLGGTPVTNQTATDVTASMVIRVTAENGGIAEYTITMAPVLSDQRVILATTVGSLIDGNITMVPNNTKVSALKAGLTLPGGATVEILDGFGGVPVTNQEAADVNDTMIILVTAEDGSTAEYTITMAPELSNAKAIRATNVGTLINGNILNVPIGTKVSTLISGIVVSPRAYFEILDGAGGNPVADQFDTDISASMVIKVTAEDGSEAEYAISLAPELTNNKEIISTTIGRLKNGNITWVPMGTIISDLIDALEVSPNATLEVVNENGEAVLDPDNTEVNSSMIVQVTAEDGTVCQYSISVVNEISVSSEAIIDGYIPVDYSLDGENISLPVAWESVAGAESYALIMYDSDADDFIHWFVEEIPKFITEIYEGESGNGMEGLELNNDFIGEDGSEHYGYDGPQLLNHNYIIAIYALITPNIETLDSYASKDEFENAISSIVIGKGEISGTYAP